ncbi:MAG: MoaD/ThiS family protein [Desulfovibrio sp.]|jgi:molybdopterin converting factor small subunit|nr:MoaD/ThiS family protein [Desulfovibrio sp.]
MSVTILIPSALRSFTDRQTSVRVEGKNVGEAVAALAGLYPDIRRHLYDDAGELRPFVNLYLGETNVKNTGGTATPLKDGDELALVPAIAGGSEPALAPSVAGGGERPA